MTRKQKELLAFAVMQRAASLLEDWDEATTRGWHQDLADIDRDEAAHVIAGWMKKLPGTLWDTRLPD
jgi:hypothetical protein